MPDVLISKLANLRAIASERHVPEVDLATIDEVIETLRYFFAQPVTQWQKRHHRGTEGQWENTNEHDAKWWRASSSLWDIRALYAAPQAWRPDIIGDEIEQLRADLVSCRGTVKTELNHYERLAMVHGKTVVAANYEAEAQRLAALLDRIDSLTATPTATKGDT